MAGETALSSFLGIVSEALGENGVVVAIEEHSPDRCTSGAVRAVPAEVFPASVEEIQLILSAAREHGILLHPVSSGRNWGYGGSNPVANNSVLLNLSRLNKILAYDAELGIVTLEPGVTQGQLAKFLKEQGNVFACPVTGSSPDASITSNALERGYGANPHTDHFAAILSLEAILADGSVYKPAMAELGGTESDVIYKWGIGPYLDGLFSQSGLGIVTQITLLLAPQPQETAIVIFDPHADINLADIIHLARAIRRSASDCLSSIKIFNSLYLTAVTGMRPEESCDRRGYQAFAASNKIPPFRMIMMLHGSPAQIDACCKDIRTQTKRCKGKLIVLTESRVKKLRTVINLPLIRSLVPASLKKQFTTLLGTYALLRGQPSDQMLSLAYWKTARPADGTPLHPARDKCGLIWVPLLVPNRGKDIQDIYLQLESMIWNAGYEPLTGVTFLNQAGSVMLFGLIYDRAEYAQKIKPLVGQVLETSRAQGFMPYRMHIDQIADLPHDAAAFTLMRAIKDKIDPGNILARNKFI